MIALVVVLSIIGYLALGAVYARTQVLTIWEEQLASNRAQYSTRRFIEEWTRSESRIRLAWRVVFWPYGMLWDLLRGPAAQWFMAPVASRKSQAEQLRADARAWRDKRYSGSPAEQEMATELARICDERAQEIDL